MGNRKKKGERGEATKYITRNKACRKLQLSLHDFRRLCILKGIYPREPKHRLRVQKGNSEYKPQYLLKDIQFLSHEPLIWKFRQQRAYLKKIKNAKGKDDQQRFKMLLKNRPIYKLDHLVRERYPTFVDALRDLDDPLTLSFLFSRLKKGNRLNELMILYCRRLTVEFMHYVIEAQALRKVFISIKGYYYQAEIMGQNVTWIVPHPFRPENTTDVDLQIMRIFTEFYICVLGFVNFRLYHSLNLLYPPKLNMAEGGTEEEKEKETETEHAIISEQLASLNVDLKRNKVEDEGGETIDEHLLEESLQSVKQAREEMDKLNKFKNLFKNFKFFLNRETNMESLTFIIRAFKGQVSWDQTAAEGYTYQEDDESITHQIVDRPSVERKYLSRYYVQPQWVYDCINARMLLPIQDYFPGVTLPPHLSPFEIVNDLYVPPEKEKLEAMQRGEIPVHAFPQEEQDDNEESDDEGAEEENEEEEENQGEDEEESEMEAEEQEEAEERDPEQEKAIAEMGVTPGSRVKYKRKTAVKEEQEQYRLSVSMIPRKKKKLYKILRRQETRKFVNAEMRKVKRKVIENQMAAEVDRKKKAAMQAAEKMMQKKIKK